MRRGGMRFVRLVNDPDPLVKPSMLAQRRLNDSLERRLNDSFFPLELELERRRLVDRDGVRPAGDGS